MQSTTHPAPPGHVRRETAEIIDLTKGNAMRRPARVRIFNVKYSANLGDGLLSECLEDALIDCGASPETWSVDLAARTRYGEGAGGRSLQMRVLQTIPGPLRRHVVRIPLAIQSRRRWQPHFRSSLEGADCMVIGGGNLLADLDLNFPTKIALAVAEAARRRLPVFIYACGVSDGWSDHGRALLEKAMRRGVIRSVFVRDERSRDLWNSMVGNRFACAARVVRDPGLLAAQRYGIVPALQRMDVPLPPGHSSTVGLNITSQLALGYHSAHAPSSESLDEWYVDLARALAAQGNTIKVFTNGSPEDRACLARLRPAFEALLGETVLFPDVSTPEQLTHLIAGLDGLIAFRMHAIIAAYSCKVPFVALAWDAKLRSFVETVDRLDWLCHPVTVSADDAAALMRTAMDRGIPAVERDLVLAQARRGVALLHDEIVKSLATE